jgi:hypothetical protein
VRWIRRERGSWLNVSWLNVVRISLDRLPTVPSLESPRVPVHCLRPSRGAEEVELTLKGAARGSARILGRAMDSALMTTRELMAVEGKEAVRLRE